MSWWLDSDLQTVYFPATKHHHFSTFKLCYFVIKAHASELFVRPWSLYLGQSDITESMVTIQSPFCGYNIIECVELNGEDLSCYSNKIVSVSLRKCPYNHWHTTHTHARLTAPFPGLPRWAGTRKGKTNLDFTEASDSEWQWHQLGHIQVCTLLQTDNHASTPPLCFYRLDALPAAQPTASKHWRQKSLTYQQSVFMHFHSDKDFSEFLPTRWRQKSTDIDMEQNYVTVALCICDAF